MYETMRKAIVHYNLSSRPFNNYYVIDILSSDASFIDSESDAQITSMSAVPLSVSITSESLDPSRYMNQTVEESFSSSSGGSSQLPMAVQILMYLMYITISLAAIGGNGIVIYIILAYKRMRTVTNFFIMNLAIGDLMMAFLCIPFTFVSNIMLQYWPFGAVMCIIVSYAQAVSVFISAYTLVAISIDRYIAIIYPLRPRMTKLQSKLIIILIWFVALLTPLPTAILSKLMPRYNTAPNETVPDPQHFICQELWENQDQRSGYSWALMILQYVIPLLVLLITYARIACVLWRKRPPGEADDARDARMAASKRKMIKMMITCVFGFTLCWLPLNFLIVIGDHYEEIYSFSNIIYIWFACHWLAMSHACYNPIIYIWMNSRFRDGFKYVLRFLPCITTVNRTPDFLPHFSTTAGTGTLMTGTLKTGTLKTGTLKTGTVKTMKTMNSHLHKNGHVHSHLDDDKSPCSVNNHLT